MKKDDTVYLNDILDSIKIIEDTLKGKSKKDFWEIVTIHDTIIRRFEIIGEATKNISDDLKNKHCEVDWKRVAGLRDVLIHKYAHVDLDLIWKIAEEKTPVFKEQISKILEVKENEI